MPILIWLPKIKATGKYGLIDADGKTIAEEIYNDITPEYFGKKSISTLQKRKDNSFQQKRQEAVSADF